MYSGYNGVAILGCRPASDPYARMGMLEYGILNFSLGSSRNPDRALNLIAQEGYRVELLSDTIRGRKGSLRWEIVISRPKQNHAARYEYRHVWSSKKQPTKFQEDLKRLGEEGFTYCGDYYHILLFERPLNRQSAQGPEEYQAIPFDGKPEGIHPNLNEKLAQGWRLLVLYGDHFIIRRQAQTAGPSGLMPMQP